MNHKKFHNIIEEENTEEKEALFGRIAESLNLPEETEEITEKRVSTGWNPFKKHYRLIASLSSAFVVVCLAIIIPIALKSRVKTPSNRYSSSSDCLKVEIDYSVKDYAEVNNLPLLYIDWYDIADNVRTILYCDADDSTDIVYFEELITNGETGNTVFLYITDLYTQVDIFERFMELSKDETSLKNVDIHWHSGNTNSKAYFEYGNYRYFVELTYPMAEDEILEIVESMLP